MPAVRPDLASSLASNGLRLPSHLHSRVLHVCIGDDVIDTGIFAWCKNIDACVGKRAKHTRTQVCVVQGEGWIGALLQALRA